MKFLHRKVKEVPMNFVLVRELAAHNKKTIGDISISYHVSGDMDRFLLTLPPEEHGLPVVYDDHDNPHVSTKNMTVIEMWELLCKLGYARK